MTSPYDIADVLLDYEELILLESSRVLGSYDWEKLGDKKQEVFDECLLAYIRNKLLEGLDLETVFTGVDKEFILKIFKYNIFSMERRNDKNKIQTAVQ